MIKRVLLLGALALAMGAGVRVLTAPSPAIALYSGRDKQAAQGGLQPSPAGDGTARWRLIWTHPAPALADVSLAPDGSSVAWVDSAGSVRRIVSATGKTVWQTAALPHVNRVLVAPASGGGTVAAFAYLNPVKPVVRLLAGDMGATGATRTVPVSGAVWSAAWATNGASVVVGTGQSLLYVLPTGAAPAPAPVRVGGIPETLVTATGTDGLTLAGMWQEAGVSAWGLDGAPRWQHNESDADRTFEVHLSADGTTAVAVSARGLGQSEARIHVWEARTGRLLWSESLGGFEATARVSAHGDYIAVTYAHKPASEGDGPASERKVVLFDRNGHRFFPDKGGLYFAPQLIALSADGRRITVRDNGGYIWTLDERGRMLSRFRLPLDPATGAAPTIRETLATDDGTSLLIRRGDGQLSLYRATML